MEKQEHCNSLIISMGEAQNDNSDSSGIIENWENTVHRYVWRLQALSQWKQCNNIPDSLGKLL